MKGAIASGNKLQLCQVPVHIQAFVNNQEARGRQTEFNASQWSTRQQNADSVFLRVLKEVATPAAVNMVVKEWQRSNYYDIEEVGELHSQHEHLVRHWYPGPLAGPPAEKWSMWTVIPQPRPGGEDLFGQDDILWERDSSRRRLIVQVDSEAPRCTCQYQTAWGLPCRHLLAWQMFTCKTDEQACRELVHSDSWLSRHWHLKMREDVKQLLVSQASEAVLLVAKTYTEPDGEAPIDRASLKHVMNKCTDLAWDAGQPYSKALVRHMSSFIENVLKQGNLTQGTPWAGFPEVADPVRGTGGSVSRKKRPASGRPAGKTSKKGRGAIQEKVKCKACGKEISKNNITRHLKICRGHLR